MGFTHYDDPRGPEHFERTVLGGNPAAVLRTRFDSSTVDRLLPIAWWDWDSAKVTRNVPLICAGDVEALERAA